MALKPRLLVFDLDGTLIDSRVDLTNSVNAMLRHYGRVALDEAVVRSYIGDGASALVRRALGHADGDQATGNVLADDALVNEALGWFVDYYREHMLEATYVYAGVMQALSELRGRHPELKMAVLTNKPVGPSRGICRHFGLERFFFANYGGNSFETKKPEPEGLLRLMAEADVAAGETVMIGDSHVDVETARAAGTRALGCLYGLAPETLAAARPDVMVQSAAEWPEALGI